MSTRELVKVVVLEDGRTLNVYNPTFARVMKYLSTDSDHAGIMRAFILASTNLTEEGYNELSLLDGMRILEVVNEAMRAFVAYSQAAKGEGNG